MLLQEGIAMLAITAPVMGRKDTVHPVLLWDDRDVTLIDTGFPRQLDQLQAEFDAHDVPFGRLSRIILTHQDIDHIGNLQALAESTDAKLEILAHPIELPYIEGTRRLLRFTDEAIAGIDRMPDSVPESFRIGLKALMLNPPRAKVDRILTGDDVLPIGGGLVVIDTPGHTPGHISLYHVASRTLIAGDALVVRDGRLFGPDPATTLDLKTAQIMLRNLLGFDIAAVVCYHGGLYAEDDVMARLSELANGT